MRTSLLIWNKPWPRFDGSSAETERATPLRVALAVPQSAVPTASCLQESLMCRWVTRGASDAMRCCRREAARCRGARGQRGRSCSFHPASLPANEGAAPLRSPAGLNVLQEGPYISVATNQHSDGPVVVGRCWYCVHGSWHDVDLGPPRCEIKAGQHDLAAVG